MREFLSQLATYEIVPEKEKNILSQKASAVTDPTKPRELKIKQYQKEKELRTKVEVCALNPMNHNISLIRA